MKSQKTCKPCLYIITISIIVTLYIFLQPKIANSIFSFRRQNLLNHFITDTKKDNKVNPQLYWQLREFYCPGYYQFNRASAYRQQVFLTYNCQYLNSTDQLIDETQKNIKQKDIKNIKQNIIFKSNESIIYKSKQDQITIIFIKPAEEMKTANGYFDYREKDKDLTKDRYWYSKANIILDQ